MNIKRIIVFTIFLLVIFIFFKFGRTIYMPFIMEFMPKESIQSITDKLQDKVYSKLKSDLTLIGLNSFPENILMIAYKEQKKLEVYASVDSVWRFLKTYPFSASSGSLGPKLTEGDKQIPEGIYTIEYLNPNSIFYLSMKINYPNDFDRNKAHIEGRENLGFDIFIHGKDNTVGCIPIGDEAIEELFVLASKAMQHEMKVIISPRDFRINPEYPEIEEISWSKELYDLIKIDLEKVYH